jgi:hypothetical protein
MKAPLILSILLSTATLTEAERFSLTPLPIQSGFPSGCTDFAQAMPGETCESFVLKHHLAFFQFLAFNPQIGGPSGCPQNLYSWNWYCIGPNDGTGTGKPAATATAPPRTTLTTITVTYSAPSPTSTNPPPTTAQPQPPATTEAPVVTCAINDCWRAYERAVSGARSSQSSWCTSVLGNDPPITEARFNYFPGIPMIVGAQCTSLSMPAAPVVSSYCSCFTQGQMDWSQSII